MDCRRILLSIVVLAVLVSGCSLKYTIDQPTVSHFTYQKVDGKPLVMKVVDQRNDKTFFTGVGKLKKIDLIMENVDDPVVWLSAGLEKEFAARGLPVKVVTGNAASQADLTLAVHKYQILNHRASGFSAWESYHLFSGQLTLGDKSCTIPAFFFNTKVPVWSMNEVRDPCLNLPASIIVQEIVSKINRCAFNYVAADEQVNQMAARALAVKGDSGAICLPSIELGGTNNPAAATALQKLAENDDSLVKTCAVSALGTLGAHKEDNYFVQKFSQFTNNDKAIPLKSIGDTGTSAAFDFLKQVKTDKLYEDEYSVKYCVDTYLDK